MFSTYAAFLFPVQLHTVSRTYTYSKNVHRMQIAESHSTEKERKKKNAILNRSL